MRRRPLNEQKLARGGCTANQRRAVATAARLSAHGAHMSSSALASRCHSLCSRCCRHYHDWFASRPSSSVCPSCLDRSLLNVRRRFVHGFPRRSRLSLLRPQANCLLRKTANTRYSLQLLQPIAVTVAASVGVGCTATTVAKIVAAKVAIIKRLQRRLYHVHVFTL